MKNRRTMTPISNKQKATSKKQKTKQTQTTEMSNSNNNNRNNNACQEYANAFVASCREGHLEMAQFLLLSAKSSIDPATFTTACVVTCEHGHLPVMQHLHTSAGMLETHATFLAATATAACVDNTNRADETKYTIDWNHLYDVACQNKHTSVAEWIVSNNNNSDELLLIACKNGNLKMTQQLWCKHNKQLSQKTFESAFEVACSNGHVETATWLFRVTNSLHGAAMNTFNKACLNRDAKLVKMIMSLIPYGLSELCCGMFFHACSTGQLEVAKFMVECCGVTATTFHVAKLANVSHYFAEACKNGHVDVAKWLLSMFPAPIIDISFVSNNYHVNYGLTAFDMACKNGHLEVVQWFHEMDPVKYAYKATPKMACGITPFPTPAPAPASAETTNK